MSKKDVKTDNPAAEDKPDGNKTKFIIASVACALGIVFLGLSFTPVGVYGLLSCMLLQLACLSFLNGQKKHGYFKACKVVRIISYAAIIACLAVLIWVIIYKIGA